MRVRVAGAVNAEFSVCFVVFLLNVAHALFVQGVGISKHCVTVRRLKFLFIFETVSESRYQTNLIFYTSRFCFSRLV